MRRGAADLRVHMQAGRDHWYHDLMAAAEATGAAPVHVAAMSLALAAASGDIRATYEALRDDLAKKLELAEPAVAADYENRLRAGGLGYGDLKKALFEHYWNHFAPARARRAGSVTSAVIMC